MHIGCPCCLRVFAFRHAGLPGMHCAVQSRPCVEWYPVLLREFDYSSLIRAYRALRGRVQPPSACSSLRPAVLHNIISHAKAAEVSEAGLLCPGCMAGCLAVIRFLLPMCLQAARVKVFVASDAP